MSKSENISLWKKKSEIDYIPLFISLWFTLNAWLKDKYDPSQKDRELIEKLKKDNNRLLNKFKDLINGEGAESNTFKVYFEELYRALESADIVLHKVPKNLKNSRNKKISFANTILDWKNNEPIFENIVKNKNQKEKLKISQEFYVSRDTNNVFCAYIENLYQVRCHLFHGDLVPKGENERVIKALYLTLSMIMKEV